MAYTQGSINKEKVVQYHIIDKLIKEQGYVQRSSTNNYDKTLALDTELVIKFLKSTQADEWQKLVDHYATNAENEIFKQLTKALKQRGTLDVLRKELKIIPNIKFNFMYSKPASGMNKDLLDLYNSNILSVMDELVYSNKNDNRIDIVLFINGIPVSTMECKNLPTGTTFRHAEHQYRNDRKPAGEPLLEYKRGALVHFALDEDNISMTTRLQNGKTFFLPFNRGNHGGAGNSDIDNEFRIAYLYKDLPESKAVLSREIFIDIISRFMHLSKEEKNGVMKEIMIFPRYHQLDAVLNILSHAKENNSGHSYLIQHSAGSGKSNTIAWAAHRLSSLHDEEDKPIFQTAIIVTDRVVLDRQLQKTVSQFAQEKGVVKKIDGTSKQLKEAIQDNAKIIISTIQKFSTDHIKEISGQKDRKFAILIDEAHSSQSGSHATNLSKALAKDDQATSEDIENIILDHQKQRGPQNNISYFAFTATPRNITLERFGTKDINGKPNPFHLYSMRQAIEEGFILDVLKNYTTYKDYYQLEKTIEDDPRYPSKVGKRKVARFAAWHPVAIDQKVSVIIEHFKRHVAKELNGQAKAMIVTQSREHALKYYFGVKKYIEENSYDDLKALIAFSGELEYEGETYTEIQLNEMPEANLPKNFDTDEYQLLIVAEKYQTGFDQPKLCAMYVDRKLESLQAVQTLARLNRTMQGKDKTFILDFQNTVEEIQNAFKPYYELTEIDDISDPSQVYDLEGRIHSFDIIDKDEVERFSEIYFKGALEPTDRINLERLVKNAVERFKFEEDEGKQEEFRQLLKSYSRFYSFVAQVMQLGDTDLEKLYAYASWLIKLLPSREVPAEINITDDMIRLQAYRVEEKEHGDASLSSGDVDTLSGIKDFGAKPPKEDEELDLSDIITSFNEAHGTNFDKDDFLQFNTFKNDTMKNENLIDQMKNNPRDVVYKTYAQEFFENAVKRMASGDDVNQIFLNDTAIQDIIIRKCFEESLKQIKQSD